MQITEVKVFPIHEEKLRAFVSVVFDGCFMINDIKVIRGRDGLFISMPSRKKKNGEFKDVAHPLNNETRRMIETHILAEYERMLGEQGGAPVASPVAGPTNGSGAYRPDAPMLHAAAPPERAEVSQGGSPAAPAVEPLEAGPPEPGPEGRTLEEIEELHLRDSFWTVS